MSKCMVNVFDPDYMAKRDISLKKKKEKEATKLYNKLSNNKDK